ncbi:MAG: hemin uptake protein HemP [Rhodanobacter sp.]
MSILSLSRPLPPAARASLVASMQHATPEPTRTVSSQLLMAGTRELVIRHRDAEYHLRVTRNDKLILTK